jgi:hypothetical protein
MEIALARYLGTIIRSPMGWGLCSIALSVVGHIHSLHAGVSCIVVTCHVNCRVRGRDGYLPSS